MNSSENPSTQPSEEVELSQTMTAKRVRDSVQVKKREGNLVQTMFFNEEQIDQMKSLAEKDSDG